MTAPLPDTLPDDHPVADAMRYLAELHAQRPWLAPSELLERIVEDRHVLELGASAGRFRDIARRIRFVVDQARSFGQATSGTLREYLAWALRQGAEGARVVETVLPETDDDAVRIMTVHGAKGLEFPIVIASGMTTRAAARRGGVQVLFPTAGGCEIRLASGIQTDQFELHKPVDEEMGFHEKLRLLYVACTRARDHLVVSAHRKARNLGDDQSSWTHAELLWHAAAGCGVRRGFGRAAPRCARCRIAPAAAPPDRAIWQAERERAFARGRARRFVAATTLARRADERAAATDPGLAEGTARPRAAAVEQGPLRHRDRPGRARGAPDRRPRHRRGHRRRRGRAGRSRRRARPGSDDRRARAPRPSRARPCRPRARTRTGGRPTSRSRVEGLTLEGYVDLVFRDERGLVVVDYKTDAIGDEAELARRLDHYRIQGAAYALAVARRSGRSGGRLRVRVPRSRRCPRGHDRRRRAGRRGRRGARSWSRPSAPIRHPSRPAVFAEP